jgi:ABC-type antimicrobial peptide transport system permease subunit
MFEEMWQDLGLAWRGLRRAKAFTAAAVRSQATGIAGISLTFALVNGVLLRGRFDGCGERSRHLLFRVALLDPVAIVTAMLLLVAVSASASYLPVRRAARVDPIALLKTV